VQPARCYIDRVGDARNKRRGSALPVETHAPASDVAIAERHASVGESEREPDDIGDSLNRGRRVAEFVGSISQLSLIVATPATDGAISEQRTGELTSNCDLGRARETGNQTGNRGLLDDAECRSHPHKAPAIHGASGHEHARRNRSRSDRLRAASGTVNQEKDER
jgi:hypothetical protein